MQLPIIDIFAGPGGLGEGFSAFENDEGERPFKIALSIEKDYWAHQTLTLRSFFRQFEPNKVPDKYYQFVRGEIKLKDLYEAYPSESKAAEEESWQATLGEIPSKDVDDKILKALNGEKNWLLIGGPPCQAYSVVGRVRRQQNILDESKDHRVGLYKQYLRILAVHNPAVFVMENVKGLLSATTEKSPVFTKILEDLSNPTKLYSKDHGQSDKVFPAPTYKIFSLVVEPKEFDIYENPIISQKDFLIRCENFGVPQTRHRVILLGVRNDIEQIPDVLEKQNPIPISMVLSGLTKLRAKMSRGKDIGDKWKDSIKALFEKELLNEIPPAIFQKLNEEFEEIKLPAHGSGKEFVPDKLISSDYRADWFIDGNINGVCNHSSRGHMESDLHRYFFISCFALVKKYSPQLADFPKTLLPNHKNVYNKDGNITRKFADRFRVQVKEKPSKTITSHISQDGHYYIHYDPTQCRSLTVREAARIQTFPDNYFFCGPRTSQFIQVGNAVPSLLANQIASVVNKLMEKHESSKTLEINIEENVLVNVG